MQQVRDPWKGCGERKQGLPRSLEMDRAREGRRPLASAGERGESAVEGHGKG